MIEAGAVQTQLKEDIDTRCLSNKLNSKKHKTSNHANLWTSWSLSVNQAALPTCKHPVAIWCSCSKEFVTDFIGHKTVWLIWIRHKKNDSKTNTSRVFSAQFTLPMIHHHHSKMMQTQQCKFVQSDHKNWVFITSQDNPSFSYGATGGYITQSLW